MNIKGVTGLEKYIIDCSYYNDFFSNCSRQILLINSYNIRNLFFNQLLSEK